LHIGIMRALNRRVDRFNLDRKGRHWGELARDR
jgi:hypothetical protein